MRCEILLRKTLGKRIDRSKIRERAFNVRLVRGRGHTVGHKIAFRNSLDNAEKAPLGSYRNSLAQKWHIKEDELAGSALVKGAELYNRQLTLEPRSLGLCCNGQNNGSLTAVCTSIRKESDVTAVFVVTRNVEKQVFKRPDARLLVSRRLCGSDAR